MKAVLKFDLEVNSDDMALKRCHKSLAMALILFELTYNTKKKIQYMDSEDPLEDFYNEFNRLMDEHSIDIDELIE